MELAMVITDSFKNSAKSGNLLSPAFWASTSTDVRTVTDLSILGYNSFTVYHSFKKNYRIHSDF
eukprot:5858377-Amphidinium_carterae.1